MMSARTRQKLAPVDPCLYIPSTPVTYDAKYEKEKAAANAAAAADAAERAARVEIRGPRALAIFAAVTIALAALDLATKWWAFEKIGPYEIVPVVPGFFNLIRAENTGSAFSMLRGQWGFFIVVSGLALALLAYFSWTALRSTWRYQVALGLVASGVVGNLYDRVKFQHVRDFLDVYVSHDGLAGWLRETVGTNHWPTFNVADAAICIGTVALLVKFTRDDRREARRAAIRGDNREHYPPHVR
jgi:signal peptidase II